MDPQSLPASVAWEGAFSSTPRRASPEEAAQFCRRLTMGRRENFAVLSRVLRPELRDDFAALYSFCRCADDLGDEVGSPDHALDLLVWWRGELQKCLAGEPHHPVFVALAVVIRKHRLPAKPFEQLLSAFEQDQRKTRYATFEDLLGYCRLSANPVGRLVLMLLGEDRDGAQPLMSDCLCTALQLANHWQDVKGDLLERNRIYLPREFIAARARGDFEARLRLTCQHGHAPDREFLGVFHEAMDAAMKQTWPFLRTGESLVERLRPENRAVVWLFGAGCRAIMSRIQDWNGETCLGRPQISRWQRASLLAGAWWKHHTGSI